jgi:hypothetical protein
VFAWSSVGFRLDSSKELVAIADGYANRKTRGPIRWVIYAAAGCVHPSSRSVTGAPGFWAAVRDVWPETREAPAAAQKHCAMALRTSLRCQPVLQTLTE